MKYNVKLPLLLFSALLWISTLQAQTFRSGLRLGLNASQIDGDEMGGFRKAGPVGGLYVAYPFTQKWAGQFEMLYSQKGSKRQFSIAGGGPGIWNKLTLHYIEVPVMMEYTVSKKLRLDLGLGGAYLFGAQLEDLNGFQNEVDFLRKYELSTVAGGHYYLGRKISVFARHSVSIFSIRKKDLPVLWHHFRYGFYSSVASFGFYYHFVPEKI